MRCSGQQEENTCQKDNPIEIEAFVENKDIGFVNPGQDAVVKIETFPFTKYGTIDAKVVSVSSDAVNDGKRGLTFPARVVPERSTLQVEGKTVNLTPGMAVTVEVKTAQRRVIEYFLSPLLHSTRMRACGNASLHDQPTKESPNEIANSCLPSCAPSRSGIRLANRADHYADRSEAGAPGRHHRMDSTQLRFYRRSGRR